MDFWGKRLPGGDNSKGPIWPRGAAPVIRLHQKGRGLDHEEDMGIDSQWDGPDTLDPWITQVWIVQVHLHGNFFHEKCMSPHTIVLHNWRLAKSRDGEPQTWRTYTVIHRFPTMLRTGAPPLGCSRVTIVVAFLAFKKSVWAWPILWPQSPLPHRVDPRCLFILSFSMFNLLTLEVGKNNCKFQRMLMGSNDHYYGRLDCSVNTTI